MEFKDAVRSFYSRWQDFSGRYSRSEYWLVMLFQSIVAACLMMLVSIPIAVSGGADVNISSLILAGLPVITFVLINIIPGIALIVRRIHDFDKSGWYYLLYFVLGLIPIINLIVHIVFLVCMCLRGTVGDNRFGPDPLGNLR